MTRPEKRLESEPLPRGRHRLDPDIVADHQRQRLLSAAGEALLEKDCWSLNVAEICSKAGVSRATFYVHFEDKLDCLAQAFDVSVAELLAKIQASCRRDQIWHEKVEGAVEAAFSWVAAAPSSAAPCLIGPGCGDGLLAERTAGRDEALAELLRQAAVQAGAETPMGVNCDEAMISGVICVAARRLRAGEATQLPELVAEISAFLLRPYGTAPSAV